GQGRREATPSQQDAAVLQDGTALLSLCTAGHLGAVDDQIAGSEMLETEESRGLAAKTPLLYPLPEAERGSRRRTPPPSPLPEAERGSGLCLAPPSPLRGGGLGGRGDVKTSVDPELGQGRGNDLVHHQPGRGGWPAPLRGHGEAVGQLVVVN